MKKTNSKNPLTNLSPQQQVLGLSLLVLTPFCLLFSLPSPIEFTLRLLIEPILWLISLLALFGYFKLKKTHPALTIWIGLFFIFFLALSRMVFFDLKNHWPKLIAQTACSLKGAQYETSYNSKIPTCIMKPAPAVMISTNFNCGDQDSCQHIKGERKETKFENQLNIKYQLDPNWKLTQGTEIDPPHAKYSIWLPPDLTVSDIDSGGVIIKRGKTPVLNIWVIYQQKNPTFSHLEKQFALDYAGSFYILEKSQDANWQQNVNFQHLGFSGGNQFILAKYPQYLQWVKGGEHQTTEQELNPLIEPNNYDPGFSAYNSDDYYMGSVGPSTVTIIDYKVLSKEEVLAILQHLKVSF